MAQGQLPEVIEGSEIKNEQKVLVGLQQKERQDRSPASNPKTPLALAACLFRLGGAGCL